MKRAREQKCDRALAGSDKQYANEGDDAEDCRQAVEDPLTVGYMDFQVVHGVVNTV